MKLPYSEGSVFALPVRSGGYARGVVARTSPQSPILFAYFFGPRLKSDKNIDLNDLRPEKAILRLRCSDMGLIDGSWPLHGRLPNWDRSAWPMPDFVRKDPLGRLRPRLIRRCDTNPTLIEEEHPVDNEAALQKDASSGQGAVEIKLDKLLARKKPH